MLVSRLELCPLFRKFWSAPWDSGWIEDSGSLLHQKYHPQISAGLLSRKSTIGSPSFSGAPPGSGFRSGYLRIRWWAALKLDPGNCFFENRHTGGLILLWHTWKSTKINTMSEQETMIMVMKVVSSDDRWQKWGWVPIKSFTLSGDQRRRLEWGLRLELSCFAFGR